MREDDSSSPSANPQVVSFAPRGTGGERWELHLSDGSSFFVSGESLQLAGVASGDLAPGRELEAGTASRLFDCSRVLEARDKGLELLARRSHAVQELRLKLARRRFAAAHVDGALAWLGERGYLDDRIFAREWVDRRTERHPEGRPALIAGLRRRGVSRDVAEEVVAGIWTAESERAAAQAALAKIRRRGGGARGGSETEHAQRLRRALQRRGFGSALILELLPPSRWGERSDPQGERSDPQGERSDPGAEPRASD